MAEKEMSPLLFFPPPSDLILPSWHQTPPNLNRYCSSTAASRLQTEDINHNFTPIFFCNTRDWWDKYAISGLEIISRPEQIPLAVCEDGGVKSPWFPFNLHRTERPKQLVPAVPWGLSKIWTVKKSISEPPSSNKHKNTTEISTSSRSAYIPHRWPFWNIGANLQN